MSELRFEFGRNWKSFSKSLDEERIRSSVINLQRLLQEDDLKGKTFLDVGSGSGLSSVAAAKLGARLFSFDYDKNSVDSTRQNLSQYCKGGSYEVQQGSAINPEYMTKLGHFDVVYSWGVLHHTGEMWNGIDLASKCVKPGGKFALAIYNDQGGASNRWKSIKKTYVNLPGFLQLGLVLFVATYFEVRSSLIRLIRMQNPLPFKDWASRKDDRGMSVWHDLVDWVGGYPFEVAKPDEIFVFLKDRGFQLESMKTCGGGHGCNEFLFTKID
ncbi:MULTISPECIES: class I SAM-dependent methyltransferase [unclassified Thalassospira]|uniref:class I SAM-dependent methyltransferase n=1 Tax=unclassified Thalassospira TaxID=2648997 RepID=UPI001B1E0483|nr:class I SAM-dependent methyltransferase [Thalassospira sp.]MBO6769739.1 class I SAM-dependent methyltransferase [Thalassospira sp.]